MVAAFPFLIVDYGHGGSVEANYQTPGKRFAFEFEDHIRFVFEGVQNRIIAADLIRRALLAGKRVYDCVAQRWWTKAPHWRQLEARDIPLSQRIAASNQISVRSGLLVSIHSNATGTLHQGSGTSASGWEFYTSRGITRSDAVANHFAEFVRGRGEHVRGIFDRGFAMVSRDSGAPRSWLSTGTIRPGKTRSESWTDLTRYPKSTGAPSPEY